MTKQGQLGFEDTFKEEAEELLPFRYSITSYGADYDVDGLVRRMQHGDIEIPAFQRSYVWNLKLASRFVESLLLGLPVPGIFLSREWDSGKLLVIDGQQRLTTLMYFYRGIFDPSNKEFALKSVQAEFEGLTYRTLSERDRRRLGDSIIHATVVRQDEPSDDDSSIYYLFERLNTGGITLTPQQIRTAIYHGPFEHELEHLNKNPMWRALYGPIDRKKQDEETILRFLALYFNGNQYRKPIKEFLNNYMGQNRHLKINTAEEVVKAFVPTVETINRCIGDVAFKPKGGRNTAFAVALMIGIARRLEEGPITDCDKVLERYQILKDDERFEQATVTATTDEVNIRTSSTLAAQAFADVP
jgi:hypothetical protein